MDQTETFTASPLTAATRPDISSMERAYQRLNSYQRDANDETGKSIKLGRQFGATFGTAFEGLVFKGRNFSDTIRTIGLSLSRLAFRAAFRPLEQGINSILSGLVSGITGIGSGSGLTTSNATPFAKGGVIASPVAFPFGKGMGVAGEAGPEAIMPLSRGPDGRLGVAAKGGGINVTFNVTATDSESFRRSETQIAALLARAIGNGQRNL